MEPLAELGVSNRAAAASKTLATVLGGVIQGFLTDGLRQYAAERGWMTSKAPTKEEMEKAISVRVREGMQKLTADMTYRKLGHDFLGKIIGGVVGNIAATTIIPADFDATNPADGLKRGAEGMAAFLSGWFAGVHLGAAFGNLIDNCVAKPAVRSPEKKDESASSAENSSSCAEFKDPIVFSETSFNPGKGSDSEEASSFTESESMSDSKLG